VKTKEKSDKLKDDLLILKELMKSKGQIDRFGVPKNIGVDNTFDSLKDRDWKKNIKKACEDHWEDETEEDKEKVIQYINDEVVPEMLDAMGVKTGEMFQGRLKNFRGMLRKAIQRAFSKKKDRKFYKAYHYELMDDLQPYWDEEELPIDPDTNKPYYVQTYFESLADKHDVHFKTIEGFARDEHPKNRKKK